MLVTSIMHSLKPLASAMVIFLLSSYVLAVWLTQIVSEHRAAQGAHSTEERDLQRYYGSLGASLLTVFQCTTGGLDWRDALTPLMNEISVLAAPLFSLYIAFVLLALMNVVTGVFVESALYSAKDEKDYFMINNVRE